MKLRIAIAVVLLLGFAPGAWAERALTLEQFIMLAVQNDRLFEEILIENAALAYKADATLSPQDIVLAVKSEHSLEIRDESEPSGTTSVSLGKLFRKTGTALDVSYSGANGGGSGSAAVSISQDVARNAFGRAGRMEERLVGVEIDLARHQVVEAYEDYVASLMSTWYGWYESHENLKTARSSYAENLKLLENIKQRREGKVALDIDVNKISVQVLGKEQGIVEREAAYRIYQNRITRAVGEPEGNELTPLFSAESKGSVASDSWLKEFVGTSRTAEVLTMLEKKGVLEADLYSDDILPSVTLSASFQTGGTGYDLSGSDNEAYVGVELGWPIVGKQDRAQYETAKIELRKTMVSASNTIDLIVTDLKNLLVQIERENKLIDIVEKKIKLGESVVKDEIENYSYGKATLNDFIREVNTLETEKLSRISHVVRLKQLETEWLRLTDCLVQKSFATLGSK